jgi:hypothetical protein
MNGQMDPVGRSARFRMLRFGLAPLTYMDSGVLIQMGSGQTTFRGASTLRRKVGFSRIFGSHYRIDGRS